MNPLQSHSSRAHRPAIIVLATAGVGILYLTVFASPLGQWWRLDRQLVQAREKLLVMERTLHQREQVEALCKKFEQRILAQGSDAEETGLILKELEALTRAANVTVKSIRPLPAQGIGNYRKFVVSLEVEARVQGMFEMLGAIDASSKILTVESLTLRALRSGPNLLSATILVSRMTSGSGQSKQQPPLASI